MSNPVDFSILSDKVKLDTPEDWTQFEASLLTIGLFEHFPLPSHQKHESDDNMTRLWRSVVTRALFDCLRGPTVDASQPPRKNPGRPSRQYQKRLKHYNEVVLKRSSAIYKDAIHWLYEGKTVNDWLDSEGSEVYERDTDFVQVCDLASLDPALVKSTFLKLMSMKGRVVNV